MRFIYCEQAANGVCFRESFQGGARSITTSEPGRTLVSGLVSSAQCTSKLDGKPLARGTRLIPTLVTAKDDWEVTACTSSAAAGGHWRPRAFSISARTIALFRRERRLRKVARMKEITACRHALLATERR